MKSINRKDRKVPAEAAKFCFIESHPGKSKKIHLCTFVVKKEWENGEKGEEKSYIRINPRYL